MVGEGCPNLLDLIPNRESDTQKRHGCGGGGSDESNNNKLELRLGLPGGDDAKVWSKKVGFPNNPWNCSTRKVELQTNSEMKAFSPASAKAVHNNNNTAQKRAAPAAVVGWPPVRSFRKNLASTSSSKLVSEPQSSIPSKPLNEKPAAEHSNKGMFVKINMDGVPIGRKVDLNAYDSYEKLSSSVDKLFRGLLAAQRDSSGGENEKEQEELKPITGLLDGSGEYTLVYEDNEGDRVLVGDVPWPMFVSTVKRLRVLKTSDLPKLSLNFAGGNKKDKVRVESSSK